VNLGTFGGIRSFAFEIDNHGRVTGFYEMPGGIRHAFVWTLEGGKVDLPTLGGAGSSTGNINARGQVTGRAENASGASHAVIWQLGPARP
jgi:probable HAF family extracellular repeat protein